MIPIPSGRAEVGSLKSCGSISEAALKVVTLLYFYLQWGPRLKEIERGTKLSSFAMEATYRGPGLGGVSMQNVENFDEYSKSRKISRQFFLDTIVAEPCATGTAADA